MKILGLILFTSLSFSAYARFEGAKCSYEVLNQRVDLPPEEVIAALRECGKKEGVSPLDKLDSFAGSLFAGLDTGLMRSAPVVTDREKATSNKVTCELRKDCQILDLPVSTEYTDFLFTFSSYIQKLTPAEEVPGDCSCIHDELKALHGDKLDTELKNERDRTNKILLEALSKKFLNDFSSNMEDASFFLLKTGDMFTDTERAKDIQCIDPEAFNREIAKKCSASGITDQRFIEQRKDILLNSFGSTKLPLEQKLKFMSQEIQTISHKDDKGQEITLTRVQFDNARMGLSHRHPYGKAADEIIIKLLKHSGLINEMEKNPDETPVQVTIKFLESKKNDPSFLKNLGLSKDTEELVKDAGMLKESFRFLMNTHPGFLNVMKSQTTFQTLSDEVKRSPDLSILDILETKPLVLEQHLWSKCKDIQENFAAAVCTSDDELVSLTSTQDLDLLVMNADTEENEEPDAQLRELLVCKEKSKGKEPSVRNLAALYDSRLPVRKSDYLERVLESDIKKHKNLFSRSLLLGTDEIFKEGLEKAAEYGQSIAKPVSGVGVEAAVAEARAIVDGKKLAFGKPSMTRAQATTFLQENAKYEAKKYGPAVASKASNQKTDTEVSPSSKSSEVAPSSDIRPGAVATPAYTNTPAKEQLTRHLSKKNKPEAVKKAVEALDEKSLEDLNKLRTGDNQILANSLREETKKLEDFQSRMKELEGKIEDAKNPLKETVRAPASTGPSTESETVPEGRQVSKTVPVATANSTSSFSKDVPVAKTPSSEPVKQIPEKVSPVDNSTSGITVSTNTQEDKLIQEVKKFFERPDLSEASLEEIKNRGIRLFIEGKEVLVKFESLDENTKQFIELKLAQKKRDTQIAKLSVLKMLMKE